MARNAASSHHSTRKTLPAYAVFAAFLSAAGLPIYIHAPKFYSDEYALSLASLGAVLFGLRLLDVVQDPALGWLSERFRKQRALTVIIAGLIMIASMAGLFAAPDISAPHLWFAVMMAGIFSAFSYLTICFYAQGVKYAQTLGDDGHLRIARWRETGALIGVCAAAVAPTLFLGFSNRPFLIYAAAFALLGAIALLAMARFWDMQTDQTPSAQSSPLSGFRLVLEDRLAWRLLLVAFVNAAPVAVTSTLFLYFVESRLEAPGQEGGLLVLFFAFAAIAAPIWGKLADRFGMRETLLFAMALAILSFLGALTLGPGDVLLFALICALSGATLGADLTLLPALFARRLSQLGAPEAHGFGLWAFMSKFTLALAAVVLLPALEWGGFETGAVAQSSASLELLSLLYAALPCALKVIAIALLLRTPLRA